MIRRGTLALTTIALLLVTRTASAQHPSLAVGAAVPVSDLSSTATTGYDVDLQVRTEPMLGPLALRIDLTLDHFSGKDGAASVQMYAQTVSFLGDLGEHLYWIAGPGYYQSSSKRQISGHNFNDQRSYLGAQAAAGVNFRVIRWDGFLEVSAAKLFSAGTNTMYVPIRFGIRL